MRYASRTLAAAFVSAGAAAGVALFSAARLADAPVRGRLGGPDPAGSLASIAALAIGLLAFLALGRSIARDAPGSRPAVVAGAIGGAIGGLAAATIQSLALSGYLAAVLATYAVPPAFLAIALSSYVTIATVAAAGLGAAVSYLGWHRARPAT